MENRLVKVEFELGIEKKKRTEKLTGLLFFSFPFLFRFFVVRLSGRFCRLHANCSRQ